MHALRRALHSSLRSPQVRSIDSPRSQAHAQHINTVTARRVVTLPKLPSAVSNQTHSGLTRRDAPTKATNGCIRHTHTRYSCTREDSLADAVLQVAFCIQLWTAASTAVVGNAGGGGKGPQANTEHPPPILCRLLSASGKSLGSDLFWPGLARACTHTRAHTHTQTDREREMERAGACHPYSTLSPPACLHTMRASYPVDLQHLGTCRCLSRQGHHTSRCQRILQLHLSARIRVVLRAARLRWRRVHVWCHN